MDFPLMLAAMSGVLLGTTLANILWMKKLREKARSITHMECGGRLYRVIDVTPRDLTKNDRYPVEAAADDLNRLFGRLPKRMTEDRSSVDVPPGAC